MLEIITSEDRCGYFVSIYSIFKWLTKYFSSQNVTSSIPNIYTNIKSKTVIGYVNVMTTSQLNTCPHQILERGYNSCSVYLKSRQFINHCHRQLENRPLTLTRFVLWILYVFVWKEFILKRHAYFSLRFSSPSHMNYSKVSTVGLVLVGRITGWIFLNSISQVGEYWITLLYLCSENLMCLMIPIFFYKPKLKRFLSFVWVLEVWA